jgi:hypothetical protein
MRDLKDLLEPLSERPMPDRWSDIERRQMVPTLEPNRGSRIATYAVSLAILALVVLITVRLLPLGRAHGPAAGTEPPAPPAWLVDLAYRFAYENGDLTPTSAEWTFAEANTIPPSVGINSGPNPPEYLVVLQGHFTAHRSFIASQADNTTASVVIFAASATGHQVTDRGVGNVPVDLPGLQPFALPGSSHTYTDREGWSIAVPPGWSVKPFFKSASDGVRSEGATLSNQPNDNGSRNAGVSLKVSTMPTDRGANPVWTPPLSIDHFLHLLPVQPVTYGTLWFAGPNGQFSATLGTGVGASALDRAAIADVISSLTFAVPSTGPSSPSGTPSSPRSPLHS